MDTNNDNGLPTPEPSASWDMPQPENTTAPASGATEAQQPSEQAVTPEEASSLDSEAPAASTEQPAPAQQPTEQAPAAPPAAPPPPPYQTQPQAGAIPPSEEVTASSGTYREPQGYAPPTQPGGAVPPGTPAKKTPWGWIIGCGCGCLLVIALGMAALFGGFAWLVSQDEEELDSMFTNLEQQLEDMEADLDKSDGAETSTPEPIPVEAIDATKPGRATAIAFAEGRKEGWVALIDTNSSDWRNVKVVIGPTKDDIRTWLDLQWSDEDNNYRLVDEGPVAQYDNGEAQAVPDIYRPGRAVAIEAALVGREDWVAKIQSKTPDWKSVTVYIGPPESEWVGEIKLQWDASIDCYKVVEEKTLEYE